MDCTSSLTGSFICASPSFLAVLLFLGPVPSVLKIYRAKKHDNVLPLLPYLSMGVQCLVWTLYGILEQDYTVMLPNTFGFCLGCVYTSVYHWYSTNTKEFTRLYFVSFAVLVGVAAICDLMPKEESTWLLGVIACSGAVVFTLSPLVKLWQVIQRKSVDGMPLEMSLLVFLNCFMWTLYGKL